MGCDNGMFLRLAIFTQAFRLNNTLSNILLRCSVLFLFSSIAFANNYEEGKQAFVSKDYERAEAIMRPLAESGHAQAQVTMGILYDNGYGVEKDPATAFNWYLKAAEQGIPIVQHQVAFKYLHGIGVKKNQLEAARWWEMSAKSGLADSQFNLGLMHYRGLGIAKNYDKAIQNFQLAAEQGHGNAQYSLAVMYAFAQGMEKDYDKAIHWFQKAADQNVAQAQYNLGVFYENGYGVEADQKQAQAWYRKAASQGIAQAKEKLTDKTLAAETQPDSQSLSPDVAAIDSQKVPSPDVTTSQNNTSNLPGTAWVLQQPGETYTLQLASSISEKDIKRYLRENQLGDKATYAEVVVKGVKRYSVFYGQYQTYDDAERAKTELPARVQKAKPWIRNFGILHKLIQPPSQQG